MIEDSRTTSVTAPPDSCDPNQLGCGLQLNSFSARFKVHSPAAVLLRDCCSCLISLSQSAGFSRAPAKQHRLCVCATGCVCVFLFCCELLDSVSETAADRIYDAVNPGCTARRWLTVCFSSLVVTLQQPELKAWLQTTCGVIVSDVRFYMRESHSETSSKARWKRTITFLLASRLYEQSENQRLRNVCFLWMLMKQQLKIC